MDETKRLGIRITIHRGTNQIGGCVTEYECQGYRLFVDYGEQLPGYQHTVLDIDGLTKGDTNNSALLITHYHGDHIGKVGELDENLPIYMGKTGSQIYQEYEQHMSGIQGYEGEKHQKMVKRIQKFQHFEPGHPFTIGPFTITPIVMDHSAFDAYAFKIEADGRSVFHTGDFRTHGFRGKALPTVLEKYVGKVDCVVCEGTNIERASNQITKTERDVKQDFVNAFKENKYNVVYVSSTNIDRLFGLYHAACETDRMFIIDKFIKKMMDAAINIDKHWGKSRLYKFKEYPQAPQVLKGTINETFTRSLERNGYVLIARANDYFNKFLKEIPNKGRKTYLSMWKGYVENPNSSAYNKLLAEAVGKDYIHIHSSGHCDTESIANLFKILQPKAIIPIHTNNPAKFAEIFSDWNVIVLKDGEVYNTNPFGDIPVHETGDTILSAFSIADNQDLEDTKISSSEENLNWWKLDYHDIGKFTDSKEAKKAFQYIIPNKEVLAYEIWEESDWGLTLCDVYKYDKTFYSELKTNSPFAYGKIVLGIVRLPDSWYAIPVKIIGPATKEALRKVWDEGIFRAEACNSFNEFYKYYEPTASSAPDMIVIPLVDIETYEGKDECELIPARYLFPMEETDRLHKVKTTLK